MESENRLVFVTHNARDADADDIYVPLTVVQVTPQTATVSRKRVLCVVYLPLHLPSPSTHDIPHTHNTHTHIYSNNKTLGNTHANTRTAKSLTPSS